MTSDPKRPSDSAAKHAVGNPTTPASPNADPASAHEPKSVAPSQQNQTAVESPKPAELLDPVKQIKQWLLSRGWIGFVVVLVILGWWYWDDIEKRPPVK
jgi:hypothetical protein